MLSMLLVISLTNNPGNVITLNLHDGYDIKEFDCTVVNMISLPYNSIFVAEVSLFHAMKNEVPIIRADL